MAVWRTPSGLLVDGYCLLLYLAFRHSVSAVAGRISAQTLRPTAFGLLITIILPVPFNIIEGINALFYVKQHLLLP
jgi:hypothetical protein